MFKRRALYLAGPIAGLSYSDAKEGWRLGLVEAIKSELMGEAVCEHFEILSPMRHKEWLEGTMELAHNPGQAMTKQIMARDFDDIRRCDLFVVALPEQAERVSIGTMIELGYARCLRKPILLIRDSSLGVHDHGWVLEIPDFVAYGLEQAAGQILAFCGEGL